MAWLPEEEMYLHSIQKSAESLAAIYMSEFRHLRTVQAKFKIPIIIVGSFTGVTSFGTEIFPKGAQKWIAVGVGVVSICIAILNSIESYLKIGESANAAINTSNALQQLREDINKELSLPIEDREAAGITVLRDCYTRYQQIVSQAPPLDQTKLYYIEALAAPKIELMIQKNASKIAEDESKLPPKNSLESRRSGFFNFFTKSQRDQKEIKEVCMSKENTIIPPPKPEQCVMENEVYVDTHKLDPKPSIRTSVEHVKLDHISTSEEGTQKRLYKMTDNYEVMFDKLTQPHSESVDNTNNIEHIVEISLSPESQGSQGSKVTTDNLYKLAESNGNFTSISIGTAEPEVLNENNIVVNNNSNNFAETKSVRSQNFNISSDDE
jgi:hypothetical protein